MAASAAGRAILKLARNLSRIAQPCPLQAAIVVSEIKDRLSPNMAPPTTAPTTQPTSPAVESPLPSASLTPDATAGGSVIEGFVEGETVKESDLPEKVAQAIRDAYEQVKIKTITFATYMNDQVYHVILSEPAGEDKVEQFYIKADGTIVPYTAEGTASPAA